MDLKFSPAAGNDLQAIYDYIAETHYLKDTAKNIVSDILNDCHLLIKNPLLGASLSNKILRQTDLRYLISKKYMIIYQPVIADNVVRIIRILDTRTDYLRILAKY